MKKHGHLLKLLNLREGPQGLYPEPRIWADYRDLEGLGVHFSYGFLKNAGESFHPINTDKALMHPYDEVLVFAPCNASKDILDLNAEITITLGREFEEHVINEPSAVVIPRGTPHGPITVRALEEPIVHYLVGLWPEYKAVSTPREGKSRGMNYSHLIKRFRGAWLLLSKKLARTMPPGVRARNPGNADQIAWFSGKDLEGIELNISWGFYSSPGIWHGTQGGGAHIHPVDEVLFFLGLNPNDINYLGAEIEIGLGEEDERHVINRPTAVVAPKNFVHCPVITRWVETPYAHFHLYLGLKYEARWLFTQ